MTSEETIKLTEQYEHKLNAYHETGSDYLPPELRKLQTYIIQVHAAYEKAISALIGINYMKDDLEKRRFIEFIASITFEKKLQAVQSFEADFPVESAKKLNSLRNIFVHQQGETLRSRYGTNAQILKKLKSLSKYYDDLNYFWLTYQGTMTPEDAQAHINFNNGKYFS